MNVKILVAVWGADYITRFERFGLSSFLAEGNLPALSKTCNIELVFLTCAGDESRFESLPLMAEIRRFASVRYIAIDDLIAPGHYSTTLTLAFTRGVAFFGEAMTRSWFVFWNADFVLSDGAFAHLVELMRQGRKVIITGTLRAVSEVAEPILDRWRAEGSGVLSAASRTLVDLSFRYTHPHHVAKTVNQELCWTSMPSQMLWRVDAGTQLGRFFKAFMFCLQPTRVLTDINGPCDYSFVPEYCPGEPQHLIDDSDDAFILELQPRSAEAEFIELGPAQEDERRACMNEWLTLEHLDTGRRVVTLRSADSPSEHIARAGRDFQAYFDRFMEGVGAPVSHAGQYYWLFGCAAWRIHRDAHLADQPDPPELKTRVSLEELEHPTNARHRAEAARRMGLIRRRGGALRRAGFGAPYRPARLHPDAGARPLLESAAAKLKQAAGPSGAVLTVAELGGWADLEFPPGEPRQYRLEPAIAGAWKLEGPPLADAAFLYGGPGWDLDLPRVLDSMSGALADGAPVVLVLHAPAFHGSDWVRNRTTDTLALFGQLEGLDVTVHEGRRRDQRYAARSLEALHHLRHGHGPVRRVRAALRLAWLMTVRALGLGSRAPSGQPYVAVITGRHAGRGRETAA